MNHTIVEFSAPEYLDEINQEISNWEQENKVKRLWLQDATLWTNSDESKWMGWLNVAREDSEIPQIEMLSGEIKAKGFTDILLMGMGGSSLCPAMMAKTFGKINGYPKLHVLDSTDPSQILNIEKKIDITKTFFIVSSKSGGTLEPNIFKNYFYSQLQKKLDKNDVSDRFMVITDPGTKLEKIAKDENFKAIFYGVTSIGGRYSALSNFGMVPLGLMGVNVEEFLSPVKIMRQQCLPTVSVQDNPGVVLGIILGICAKNGKDKITLIVSPAIEALGAWLEQLLAESTGKSGKGLIPVDQESLGKPSVYSEDRVFVYIRLTVSPDPHQDQMMDQLEKAGFVVIRLTVVDKMHLGAELFRWEIATDVVGSIIGIDPFNQPDVEDSKVLTIQLTEQYEKTGQLSQLNPFFSDEGLSLFADEKNLDEIKQQLIGEPNISGYLRAHLDRIMLGNYMNLSAFIEMSDKHDALLQESRLLIRDNKKVATCLGFGPRFLHSTGQAYKGGPNTGVFLQITADHPKDIQVPGYGYSFGLVIAAQAQADFTVLAKRSRRLLRIHLGSDVQGGLGKLKNIIKLLFNK